ncbi:unnamed protein product [Toxocara canis]|uniref:EGF-like domain-containing protein n=1 Tax=Toxocara canis TaxID=6265 RepID=A0A183U7C8_TOXCA|nr:unnamed protein product [Toxocara canis]
MLRLYETARSGGFPVENGFIGKEKPKYNDSEKRCWCKPGFTGSLCEYSEDMRQCEEDYCLHKGIGRLENVSGVITCKCICEENYGGERVSDTLS